MLGSPGWRRLLRGGVVLKGQATAGCERRKGVKGEDGGLIERMRGGIFGLDV
jgi:hypothetical protein